MTDGAPSGCRSPLAGLVELFVLAPIGLAVRVKRHLPDLVATGRHQAETQVRLAHMVGEFAVRIGRQELLRRVERAFTSDGGAAPPVTPEAPMPPTAATVVPIRRDAAPGDQASPRADDLPIPGYDSLAASQVVERLAALSPAELAGVLAYETAHRHRRTVLHRIDQLVG